MRNRLIGWITIIFAISLVGLAFISLFKISPYQDKPIYPVVSKFLTIDGDTVYIYNSGHVYVQKHKK